MEKLRWFFKHGECYEDFNVLYGDEKYVLVENCNTGALSFGLRRDFGTLFGFPVSQSCLTRDEAIEMLHKFIEIDERYYDCNATMHVWERMLETLGAR